MGRGRWGLVALAVLVLAATEHALGQDENDFYYTPVERSFAQVQPPLFPNSRPTTYFESTSGFGIQQPESVNAPRQHVINDERTGFPAPHYNQHPAPFQLSTGKGQSNSEFFVGQPDFTQRQRFRPSFPHNYQLVHPASTRRPDASQIHSVAYQNDPSKPETFLGQVTLNNPDIDYLQNNRFKNTPFNGNSLKNVNHHNHGFPIDVDDDDDDRDLFEDHKVTTYNPLKLVNRQRLSNRPVFNPIRQHERASERNSSNFSYLENNTDLRNNPSRNAFNNNNNMKLPYFAESPKLLPDLYNKKLPHSVSTDYKTFHDIEPLLEDDISDLNSFKELMKNNQGSLDVQVIKSGEEDLNRDVEKYDSNPSATSMAMSNTSKEVPENNITIPKLNTSVTEKIPDNLVDENKSGHHILNINSTDNESEEEESVEQHVGVDDDSEYVEYYDDAENAENPGTIKKPSTTIHPDIYDEYDSTEVNEESNEKLTTNITKSFDILMLKPNSTIMKDDNFKDFIDTTSIDHKEDIAHKEPIKDIIETTTTEEINTVETPAILGQEVVSVVTTKSVVNGTISVPDVNYISSTINPSTSSENITLNSNKFGSRGISTESPIINTTENWIVVASVQTSRSVSGARFLPFPTVEQEEKKQVLIDADEIDDDTTLRKNPQHENEKNSNKRVKTSLPENISDKLDSIQSELSSAVLEGGLEDDVKNITLITEPIEKPTTTTTTSLNIFTLKSTQISPTTEKSSPEPLPVLIKKFTPRVTTTTTPKPKIKPSLVTVMDDLTGLLPPGYKPRTSYKDKRLSTTTTTTSTTTTTVRALTVSKDDDLINGTQPRSSGINSKNKVIILDYKTLLPRDYKPKETSKQQDELFKSLKEDDISKFLPPDFKFTTTEKSRKENETAVILDKVKKADSSSFLPKDYKQSSSTTEKLLDVSKLLANSDSVNINAFLPPGFKTNESSNDNNNTLISKFKVTDVSSLLPPGFNLNETDNNRESSSTKSPSNAFKVVFPSRPGSKSTRKITTPKSNSNFGPSPVTPKIQKGWPTRASTEFTGWPTPSTTPFSIEKLLEAQRNATATTRAPEPSTEATTRRMATTTTTTPIPPPSTTPGVCRHECDLAATIKIVSGVKWVPELLDHHTQEWQNLAKDVKEELNSVYSKSDYLKKWYKGVRIDAFSKGSVLVDYFIELNEVEERIDTLDLKKLFHKSLTQAKPGSVIENVTEESDVEFDPDVMLGDQPEEDRMKKDNEKVTKIIDKSAGKLEMGKFVMDPAYTEFIVLPKRDEQTAMQPDEESFLPQWGIAVIVIALASLLFVVIFGVTVLVNRQKSAKAKQPIPLSEDMLHELDKSHMGGFDDIHQMKERELPYLPQGKRMSTAFIEQLAYPNPGDSWRSEWTPQLQKYMQHYTPDSGRGSQIYGAAGNLYGYSGSQLYGQSGAGGGSQLYGYAGEHTRSHHSRRRSDYDSNF